LKRFDVIHEQYRQPQPGEASSRCSPLVIKGVTWLKDKSVLKRLHRKAIAIPVSGSKEKAVS
jgi:hypothetical protein